jgi:hypothetical protein
MNFPGIGVRQVHRAIGQRNLFAAEVALPEMGNRSLMLALDYLVLLAELQPRRRRWRLSDGMADLSQSANADTC